MPLPFEPAGLPLLPGGLPHRSAAQALEVSRRYAELLLAWPQLPQRSFREQSYVQGAIGFPGLVIDAAHARLHVEREAAERGLDRLTLAYLEHDIAYGALAPDDAAGLEELLRQSHTLKGTLALKGQLLGPISLAAQLTDERQRPLIYTNVLFEALAQHLQLRAAWQEARLSERTAATIICLEEPFLETVGLPFLPIDWDVACDQIDVVLSGISGCRALFAGGAVDWAKVLQTSVEMIIADAYDHGQSLVAAAAALPAFLEHDGIVGLGIVPADEDALNHTTAERLLRCIANLLDDLERAGVAVDRLLRQSVVSTSGSLGHLGVAAAERALQLVAEVSQLVRTKYELT